MTVLCISFAIACASLAALRSLARIADITASSALAAAASILIRFFSDRRSIRLILSCLTAFFASLNNELKSIRRFDGGSGNGGSGIASICASQEAIATSRVNPSIIQFVFILRFWSLPLGLMDNLSRKLDRCFIAVSDL